MTFSVYLFVATEANNVEIIFKFFFFEIFVRYVKNELSILILNEDKRAVIVARIRLDIKRVKRIVEDAWSNASAES